MERKTLYIRSFIFLLLLGGAVSAPFAQDAPEKYGWSFRNFGTPSFNWDVYRNSMFGIPQDSSGVTAPFDLLFYNACFKDKLSPPGNCYGLSLLSALMNIDGGHLGYCCPTNFYGGVSGVGPTDPKLLRAINIMHGHQVSLASIQYFFDQILNGHSQDATFVTPLAQQALDKEGIFLISITKGLSPTDGGHTLIAYKMTHLGGSNYRIYVVDPNRIWSDSITSDNRDYYTLGKNYVDCSGSTWKFRMAGAATDWPIPHGHLTVLPVSIAAPTGRVPSSLGLAVGELLNKIFIAHDGEDALITQITSHGKRLYLPGTEQIDWDTRTGLRTMSPFYPSDAPPNGKEFQFELFYNFGAMRDAEIEFRSGTQGAKVVMGDNTGYAMVDCHDPNATATVALSGIGTASPTVRIEHASKQLVCDLTLLIPTVVGNTNRVFTLRNVEVPEDGVTELSVSAAKDVVVRGTSRQGAALVVRQESVEKDNNFVTDEILVTPQYQPQWSESDWMRLREPMVPQLTGK